jgi:hypothetical protein
MFKLNSASAASCNFHFEFNIDKSMSFCVHCVRLQSLVKRFVLGANGVLVLGKNPSETAPGVGNKDYTKLRVSKVFLCCF